LNERGFIVFENLNLLDQFNGMECLIFSYPIEKTNSRYVSKSFIYELDKNFLRLKDMTNEMVGSNIILSEITGIESLGEDIYHDLIRVRTNDNITYAIKTIEKPPIPIHCDKCGHQFKNEQDQIWFINQQGEYGSIHDGDWISKKLCDHCVTDLIGM